MSYPRVRYEMIDIDRGRNIESETIPKGWDESEKTIKRSKKTFGIFTELSKNLEFVEDFADFLRIAWINKEIEADVILKEWRNHPREDSEYLHSVGTFDFSKYESTELSVKVPFKSGGLQAIIKAQLKQKFELERLESINNKTIDALKKTTVALDGRQIFLVTTWDSDNSNTKTGSLGNQNFSAQIHSSSGGTRSNTNSLPYQILGQSHNPWAVGPVGTYSEALMDNINSSESARMFFLINDQQRTLDVTVNYDYYIWWQRYEQIQWGRYYLSLTIFDGNYDVKRRYLIDELYSPRVGATTVGSGVYNNIRGASAAPIQRGILPQDKHNNQNFGPTHMIGTYNRTIVIENGDSVCLETLLWGDHYNRNNAGIRAYVQNNKSELKIEEESYADPSQSPIVLFHELGEKLLQIFTGEKLLFKTEFYGRTDIPDINYDEDGEFAYTGFLSGFWVRGFHEKNLEFSLAHLLDTSHAIHNTGHAVINIDGKELFIVEDMKWFFRPETFIILTQQVSNVKRTAADNLYHASLSFGYKKPEGDNLYEEALGLDEYNTRTEYSCPITRVDTKYDKISRARADSYGMEFARRKQRELFPETDTRYDKTVFVLDCKKGPGLSVEQRKWQDDYVQAPTGVFSPATATNLRITPRENQQRHQWIFGSGLKVFPTNSITHINSVGNSFLGLRKSGESEKLERDSVLISDFERPLFKNEYIEFEHEVDYDVNQQLFGTTEVDGKQVPNYYGKVQFINEEGLKEYGYLIEVKPNKEGKWKLLKAI